MNTQDSPTTQTRGLFETRPIDVPLYPIIGVFLTIIGLSLRCFARSIAWPDEYTFSGPREATAWAFREKLYIDLGIIALVFGLALIFLAIVRASNSK